MTEADIARLRAGIAAGEARIDHLTRRPRAPMRAVALVPFLIFLVVMLGLAAVAHWISRGGAT